MSPAGACYDGAMVMQERRRYLTVEEARSLPPPGEERLARAGAILAAAADRLEASIVAGAHCLSEEEILWALDRDEAEDGLDDLPASGPAT